MLYITLICIGKTNESYVKEGMDKYMKLLGKYCKLNVIELHDVKNANKLPSDRLKEEEGKLLGQHIPDKCAVIFMDEAGKSMDSIKFSGFMEKKSLESSHVVFIVGGSYGLSADIKRRGESLSLSAMTFNHQMVRVILLEQIFRAFTIQKGTGYHH